MNPKSKQIGEKSLALVPATPAGLAKTEVSWFATLCLARCECLGVTIGKLRYIWEHSSNIVRTTEPQLCLRVTRSRKNFDRPVFNRFQPLAKARPDGGDQTIIVRQATHVARNTGALL